MDYDADLAADDEPDATAAAPELGAVLARAEQARARHDLEAGYAAAAAAWARLGADAASAPSGAPSGGAGAAAPPPPLRAQAGLLLAHFAYRLGRFERLMAEGPAIVGAARAAGLTAEACQVLRSMALGGSDLGAFDAAIEAARLGLALAGQIGSVALQVLLTNALAACFERMGDPWQAERLLRDALVLAHERGGEVERFVSHNNLCATALTGYYLLRDGAAADAARAWLQRGRDDALAGLALVERIGDPFYSVFIHANAGDALMFLGAHDAGQAHLEHALALAEAHGFHTQVWRVRCSLGELALERHQPAAARTGLLALAQAMGERAPPVTVMRCQHALYRALRQLGQVDQALLCFERFHAMDRRRVVSQLEAQAHNLVTRAEIEQAHRDARFHRAQAASLAEQAARDALTGLANRRGLEQHLLALRAASGARALAVAMLDIDAFKTINDRHGHAAGDAVLVRAARLLLMHVRQHDIVARLGGDEFVLVLPEADAEQARAVLERIRTSAQTPAGAADPPVPGFRFSAGVAVMPSAWDGAQPLGQWLADADAALYAGKRAGGDTTRLRARS